MDLSKLGQNEKLAMYGAVAVIVGGLVGYSYGLTVLAVLAAVTALAVIFLPQLSPSTSLPGSRGSLLVVAGGIAAAVMVLALLMYLSVIFTNFNFRDLFFLVAVAGAVVMAWAGWQELQAEGGKFQLGTSASGSATAAPTGAAPAASAESAPATAAAAPVVTAAAPAAAAPTQEAVAAPDVPRSEAVASEAVASATPSADPAERAPTNDPAEPRPPA